MEVSVDDDDFEIVSAHRWFFQPKGTHGYAGRSIQENGKQRTELMHRVLMRKSLVEGMVVDHIDGNGLNNQRANLRVCTPAENSRNRLSGGSTSAFNGVSFVKKTGKWQVMVQPDYDQICLGFYESEQVAAGVYNSGAKRLYLDFARLNVVHPLFQDDLMERHIRKQEARMDLPSKNLSRLLTT